MRRITGLFIRLLHGAVSALARCCAIGFIISFIAFVASATFTLHDATDAYDAVHHIDLRDHSVHHYITNLELYICICTGSAFAGFAIAGGTGINFCEWIERNFPPDQWGYAPLSKR